MNGTLQTKKAATAKAATAVAISLLGITAAFGQMSMDSAQTSSTAATAFEQENHVAMEKMHKDMMSQPMSGDPDRDFLIMMIPHHQGAVDMAELEIKYGKDPEVKAMAEKIVKDQKKEIRGMNDHLKRLEKTTSGTKTGASGGHHDGAASHEGHSHNSHEGHSQNM